PPRFSPACGSLTCTALRSRSSRSTATNTCWSKPSHEMAVRPDARSGLLLVKLPAVARRRAGRRAGRSSLFLYRRFHRSQTRGLRIGGAFCHVGSGRALALLFGFRVRSCATRRSGVARSTPVCARLRGARRGILFL